MRSYSPRLLVILSLTAWLSGCTHPRSAQEIADAGGLNAANQKAAQSKVKKPITASSSTVIGKVSWASRPENIGVISLTVPPLPADTILIARTTGLTPVCIMRTTLTARGHTQGVILVSGVPNTGDQVIQPGPEYIPLLNANLGSSSNRSAKESFQAAGTADPTVIPGM